MIRSSEARGATGKFALGLHVQLRKSFFLPCRVTPQAWITPALVGEVWLGGLDSNQDNQIQSLMYYQLYDLPAEWAYSLQHSQS